MDVSSRIKGLGKAVCTERSAVGNGQASTFNAETMGNSTVMEQRPNPVISFTSAARLCLFIKLLLNNRHESFSVRNQRIPIICGCMFSHVT